MKILVCIKQVPDTLEVKLSSNYTLQRDFVAQVINPADESALELGLTLRDKLGGSLTVMTMGRPKAEGMLREMLSRGADEAVLLTDSAFAGADTLATAKTLVGAIHVLGGFDLILMGRRAIDGETGQVGPMVASLLDIPCVANATKANVAGSMLTAEQLTEAGTLSWRCELPGLVTLCEWTYALRLPSLSGLRRAKTQEIRRLTAGDLGLAPQGIGLAGSPTRVIHAEPRPVGVRDCKRLNLPQLLEVLQ